jgi:hypothetical protein
MWRVLRQPYMQLPRKVAITFGDDNYRTQRDNLARELRALEMFDLVRVYTPGSLSVEFRDFLAPYRNHRGAGFFLWKPFICLEAARNMSDGEYLVYIDAGCSVRPEYRARFDDYFDMARTSPSGILCFQMGHLPEQDWAKGDIFAHLGLESNGPEATSGQMIGTFWVLHLNPRSRQLLADWYDIARHHTHLFTDTTGTLPNAPSFKENRHDQSVWSLLNKMAGSTAIADETYGPAARVIVATRRRG